MRAIDVATKGTTLDDELIAHTGRFVDKRFDWNAFPSNAGFEDLARAQMRYIGAGGSPKVDDPSTLAADHFTLSLVYKEPGRYAACHSHEIEESFLVIAGALIVGWERDGEVVEVNLGPGDMILNARDIGHGFRVDGVEPVLMSISVDVGKPQPPRYHCHPKEYPGELARRFGAGPGKTILFDRRGDHPLQRLMADYVVRKHELPGIWDDAGFLRKVYVGDAQGAVKSTTCRKEMWSLPVGLQLAPFTRDVEDAYLCLDGSVEVVWVDEHGNEAATELGPRDLVKTPAGRAHYLRNPGAGPATVWSVIGAAGADGASYARA